MESILAIFTIKFMGGRMLYIECSVIIYCDDYGVNYAPAIVSRSKRSIMFETSLNCFT